MHNIKPGFFDRIGSSFELLKNNFIPIFLPLFIYLFFTQVLVFGVIFSVFLSTIDFASLGENTNEMFLNLWSNPAVIMGVSSSIIVFLLYLILIIPFSTATMKAIRDGYHNKKSDVGENIVYGFMKLGSIFKVYWYVFAYTALIPAMVVIVGGLMLIAGMLGYGDIFMSVGGAIVGMGTILFIIFSTYRGIKASFALYHAVEYDNFERDHFNKSLVLSKDKWWRVVGNIMGFSILLSFFFSMLGGMVNLLFISGSIGDILTTVQDDITSGTEFDPDQISAILEDATGFSILAKVKEIILLVITHTQTIAIMVFMYIFYQRLTIESDTSISGNKNSSKDVIEL